MNFCTWRQCRHHGLVNIHTSKKKIVQFRSKLFPIESSHWLASISFIGQPLGSILSGLLTEPLGRRRAMMLVNIPHIVAWTMLSTAKSLEVTFMAFGLLGISVGLMEAPIMTYLSEIWWVRFAKFDEVNASGRLTRYSFLIQRAIH